MFFLWSNEWEESDREDVTAFLSLWEVALPTVTRFSCPDPSDAQSIPSLRLLIESRAELAHVRQGVRSIGSPRGKTFRKVKRDFELLLRSCDAASDWATKLARDPSRRGAFAGMIGHLTVVTELLKEIPQRVGRLRSHLVEARSDS